MSFDFIAFLSGTQLATYPTSTQQRKKMDMNSSGISSAWGQQQVRNQQSGNPSNSFASHLASNGLSAGQSNQPKSGGQLLSDDMARALASYAPVAGAKAHGTTVAGPAASIK
jgi:hypothetical protein